jgi:hypothetical protein
LEKALRFTSITELFAVAFEPSTAVVLRLGILHSGWHLKQE